MQGKTVLVTGANQGIGKATAIALAAKGADVVLVARNAEKGRAALAEVQAAGGGKAELIVADLSSQEQVRRAAAELKARHARLDVLVNNAGVYVPERHTTADGLEETFGLNHLGYFLLTRELLDVLQATPGARIVNVSSEAHRGARMRWEDLQFERTRYSGFKAYGQSKLANVLFTYELARRLEGTGVTANCLHPGVIGSGFGRTYGSALSILVKIARPFLLSPEEGARTSIYLASSPEVEGVTGKYFSKCKPVQSNALSYDVQSRQKLWSLSEQLVKAHSKAA
ncbi:MAG TPA: SDR family oxidoreductase [Polyangiaceae bacterium]|nr:SDR family oxidoreductase [Polyangiaceae bacterium]